MLTIRYRNKINLIKKFLRLRCWGALQCRLFIRIFDHFQTVKQNCEVCLCAALVKLCPIKMGRVLHRRNYTNCRSKINNENKPTKVMHAQTESQNFCPKSLYRIGCMGRPCRYNHQTNERKLWPQLVRLSFATLKQF